MLKRRRAESSYVKISIEMKKPWRQHQLCINSQKCHLNAKRDYVFLSRKAKEGLLYFYVIHSSGWKMKLYSCSSYNVCRMDEGAQKAHHQLWHLDNFGLQSRQHSLTWGDCRLLPRRRVLQPSNLVDTVWLEGLAVYLEEDYFSLRPYRHSSTWGAIHLPQRWLLRPSTSST